MRRFVIIDGYNLMHAAGLARERYGPHGLERQRERFVNYLVAHLTESERRETTVVFDAFDAPGNVEPTSHADGLTVRFAPAGTDADSAIERMITSHSAPKQLVVVSSDRRLMRAVSRRRGSAVPSEEYQARLRRRGRASDGDQSDAAHPKYSDADVNADEWLAFFGEEVDPDIIAREVREEARRAERRSAPTPPASSEKSSQTPAETPRPAQSKPAEKRRTEPQPETDEKSGASLSAEELALWSRELAAMPELAEIQEFTERSQRKRRGGT